jgi:hypothetical protein
MCGFTQDDGYAQGVAADAQRKQAKAERNMRKRARANDT